MSDAVDITEALALANHAHAEGDLVAAEAGYREVEAAGYRGSEAIYQLGTILEDRGEYEAARLAYEGAIDRGDPDAVLALAYLLGEYLDRDVDAEKLLRQAIESGDGRAFRHLGDLLSERDDTSGVAMAEAEMMYRRALDVDGEDANALYGLGEIAKERREFDAAVGLYRRAMALGSKDAVWCLAYLLARHFKRVEDGVELLRGAIGRGDSMAAMFLGGLLVELGRAREAEVAYREAIDMGCPDTDAAYQLGVLLEGRGAFDDAALAYGLAAKAGDQDATDALAKLAS